MSLSLHLVSPNSLLQPPKFQSYKPSSALPTTRPNKTLQTRCVFNSFCPDPISDLADQATKMRTEFVQKEEAMNKSRELLFNEFCRFLGLEKDEVKRIWGKLGEDDKWVLFKGFVNEWGVDFHPLSARSVKLLIEEYLYLQTQLSSSSSSSSSSSFFSWVEDNIWDFWK